MRLRKAVVIALASIAILAALAIGTQDGRCAHRAAVEPGFKAEGIGFRVVLRP